MYFRSSLFKLLIFSTYLLSTTFLFNKTVFAVDSNGYWETLNPMSSVRTAHGIAKLNDGRILITGGVDPANSSFFLKSSEIYDPISKTFTPTGNLNKGRQLAVENSTVTFSDGSVLIVGGETQGSAIPEATTELYDPATGTWSDTGNLKVARFHTALTPLPGDKALVFTGGIGGGQFTTISEIYEPTNKEWKLTGNMHIPRFLDYDFAILNDGRIMAIGGENQTTISDNRGLDSAEIYDTKTGQWTLTSQVPFRFTQGAVTVLDNGKVLVTGGLTNANPLIFKKSVAIYDPSNNKWTQVADMPKTRSNHYDHVLDDGRVLIFGGFNNDNGVYNLETTTFIYDPIADAWTEGPEMPGWFRQGKKIELNNGDLLLTGSEWNNTAYNFAYLFTNGNIENTNYLNVAYFSQNDDLWGSEEYDSASKWSNTDIGISNWGCALTSAVMILKYHGYSLLPDGTEINPSTLNSWLLKQPDNFIRNGMINWDTIKRLSREAREINNIEFSALDYTRVNYKDDNLLNLNIENNIPTILEIRTGPNSSHFVVADGTQNDTFNIKDPADIYKSLLSSYNNDYKSMRVFKPSHTDLSSILLVVNENVNLSANYNSRIINNEFQTKILPIDNDDGENESGEILNSYYIHDPESDNYTFTLSSDTKQKFKVDVYLYDKYANVKMKTFNGVLTKNSNDKLYIDFDKLNVENSKINRKRALGFELINYNKKF